MVAASPGRKVTKRAKKDPGAPKRALSAYMHFCGEARAKVRQANPDMKVTEVLKELGLQWGKLGDKDRERFHAMAAKDTLRYQKEMQSYVPPPKTFDDDDG